MEQLAFCHLDWGNDLFGRDFPSVKQARSFAIKYSKDKNVNERFRWAIIYKLDRSTGIYNEVERYEDGVLV